MNNQRNKEELDEWKKNFSVRLINFSVAVLQFSDDLRKNPTLWPVADQVVRSSTSVGANINEAQGAGSKKDFAHFFQIALKSAKETQYWLLVISHYKDEHKANAEQLLAECKEISRIINSSLLTMKGRK